MLSVYQIERYFHARHFDPLLRGVAPIGIDLPLPLEVRLSGEASAVMGLALKRVVELTYGPTALSRELTGAVLGMQNGDGSFGGTGEMRGGASVGAVRSGGQEMHNTGDALATACAIAGLSILLREHASTPNPEAAVARERAIAALANSQAMDGLFNSATDRTEDDRALTAAFILTLLGGEDDVRHALRFAELMTWFDEHAAGMNADVERLCEFGRVDADIEARRTTSGAMSAIAA